MSLSTADTREHTTLPPHPCTKLNVTILYIVTTMVSNSDGGEYLLTSLKVRSPCRLLRVWRLSKKCRLIGRFALEAVSFGPFVSNDEDVSLETCLFGKEYRTVASLILPLSFPTTLLMLRVHTNFFLAW